MRSLALAVVLAAAAPALADATVPERAPATDRSWLLDDQLVTHGPPGELKRVEPRPTAQAASEAPRAGRGTGDFEDARCPDSGSADHPLDFVDATLESGDLAARFSSARPVVKHAPAPRHTKALHAR